MKTLILSIVFICSGSFLFAQDYYEQFKKHLQKSDTTQQRLVLKNWEPTGLNDPEFYTANFNYYFYLSRQNVLSFEAEPLDEKSFVIIDSSGEENFLNNRILYLEGPLASAFEFIDEGIRKFPDRLDMRFGKIYALGLHEDYEKYTKEIIKTIDHSNSIKEKWFWEYNKPKEDARTFFIASVYSYMTHLYNTEDDNLLANIQQIGLKLQAYDPENIPVLSMLGVTYILQEDFENSIKYFSKANELDPTDYIVLNNLAQSYLKKGAYSEAKKFYKLALKYGDATAKEMARVNLKKLK